MYAPFFPNPYLFNQLLTLILNHFYSLIQLFLLGEVTALPTAGKYKIFPASLMDL